MSGGTSSGSQTGQQQTGATDALPDPWGGDPCGACKTLMQAKRDLVSGGATAEYEYHGNGTQRRIKYSLSNLSALDDMIRQAQAACAALIGVANPGRRHALTVGSRAIDGFGGVPAARWDARRGYW